MLMRVGHMLMWSGAYGYVIWHIWVCDLAHILMTRFFVVVLFGLPYTILTII